MNRETKLGFFVVAAFLVFVGAIMLLGDFTIERGYTINIIFSDIAGLPSKARVKIAGVNVGKVRRATLVDGKANLKVWLRKGVKIHTDADARIITTGIIGTRYLELTSGSSDKPLLKDGDTLIGVDAVSMDEMISSALESIKDMAAAFQTKDEDGKKLGENLAETVSNIKDITETLRKAITAQERKVIDIVSNVNSLTAKIDSLAGNIDEIVSVGKTDLKSTIANLRSISEKLDRIVTAVDAGEGIAGKMVKDKEMGENLKETVSDLRDTAKEARRIVRRLTVIETHWDASLRYDTKHNLYRPDVGLRISPSDGKYYYFGGRNLGEKREVFDPEERNTVDFHVARTAPYGSIYAGVIKSKGGIGATFRPFWKWHPFNRVELKVEGYDFFRNRPVRSPKFDVGARINLYRFIYVGGQIGDISHERNLGVYVRLFMKDEDIGYLLGLVGLARP